MPFISKFYLLDAASPNAGTLPGSGTAFINGNDTLGGDPGRRTARDATDTPGSSNPHITTTITSNADTVFQSWGYRRFVSRPLAAVSIAVTDKWTFSYARAESNLLHNQSVGIVIYGWRPSTGARVGVGEVGWNGTEPTVAATTQAESVTDTLNWANPLTLIDGDILVFEVDDGFTQGMATSYTSNFFYNGTTEGSTTTCASFVSSPTPLELSQVGFRAQPFQVSFRKPIPSIVVPQLDTIETTPGPSIYDPTQDSAYDQIVLGDLPAYGAYWKMNEKSGTTFADRGPNDLDLGLTNVTPNQYPGPDARDPILNTSALFGATSKAIAPTYDFAFPDRSPFSLEIWFYPFDSSSWSTGRQWFFTKAIPGNGYEFYADKSGQIFFNRIRSGVADQAATPATVSVVPDLWNHLVAVYDGLLLYVYLNGALAANSGSGDALLPSSDSSPLVIGGEIVDIGGAIGYLAKAAVYSTALTDVKVLNHFQAGTSSTWSPNQLAPGMRLPVSIPARRFLPIKFFDLAVPTFPVAQTFSVLFESLVTVRETYQSVVLEDGPYVFWELDDSTTAAADRSGNNHTGTHANGVLTGQSGVPAITGSLACSYDGFDDLTKSNFLLNTSSVTVECWIFLTAYPGSPGNIGGFNDLAGNYDKVLYIDANHKLVFYAYDGAAKNTTPSLASVPLNQWVHVVGTADGSNLNCYMNGALVGSVPCGPTFAGYAANNIAIDAVNGISNPMVMSADEFAVYTSALSQERIAAHYNSGSGLREHSFPIEAEQSLAATKSDPWEAIVGGIQQTKSEPLEALQAILAPNPAVFSTPLIDNFNRADENPLSGGGIWTQVKTTLPRLKVLSNQAASTAGGDIGSYYAPATFTDCEVYVTIATMATSGDSGGVAARLSDFSSGDTADGYLATADSNGRLSIRKLSNFTSITLLSQTGLGVVVAGDTIGLRCIGTTLEAWLKHSGTWTLQVTTTDSSYSSGAIGLWTSSSDIRFDDFGGGKYGEPLDALRALASTKSDPLDGLLALAATKSDPWEAIVGGIQQTKSDPFEANLGVKQTNAEPYDAIGGIAGTKSDPWEAIQSIAATKSDPWEALVAITKTNLEAWESLTAIASTKSESWEALKALIATASDPVEAIVGGIQQTKLDPWEALLGIAATKSDPWEALLALAATKSSPWEALVAIASTKSDPWESTVGATAVVQTASLVWEAIQSVASTKSDVWESLVSIASTESDAWESLVAIAKTNSESWEAIGGIASTKSDTWEALQKIAVSGLTPWEAIVGGIVATRVNSWEALLGVAATKQDSYEALGGVASSGSDVWEATGSVSSTRVSPWEAIVGGIVSTRLNPWEANLAIATSKAEAWEALLGISSASSTPWESSGNVLVTQTASLPWDALKAIAATSTDSWEGIVSIASSKAEVWEALLGIASTRSDPYDALQMIAATKLDPYETLQALVSAKSVPYEALKTLSATSLAPWDALLGIAAPSSAPWESQGHVLVTQTAELPWDALKAVASSASDPLDAIIGGISSTRTTPYEALLGIAATNPEVYESLRAIQALGVSPWDATGIVYIAVSATGELPYDATAGIRAVPSLPFEVSKNLTKTAPGPYEAQIKVLKSGSSSYETLIGIRNPSQLPLETVIAAIAKLEILPWEATGRAKIITTETGLQLDGAYHSPNFERVVVPIGGTFVILAVPSELMEGLTETGLDIGET